jgi:hypothetical protein
MSAGDESTTGVLDAEVGGDSISVSAFLVSVVGAPLVCSVPVLQEYKMQTAKYINISFFIGTPQLQRFH